MASAVFSASREVAGLLGITIIGVIVRPPNQRDTPRPPAVGDELRYRGVCCCFLASSGLRLLWPNERVPATSSCRAAAMSMECLSPFGLRCLRAGSWDGPTHQEPARRHSGAWIGGLPARTFEAPSNVVDRGRRRGFRRRGRSGARCALGGHQQRGEVPRGVQAIFDRGCIDVAVGDPARAGSRGHGDRVLPRGPECDPRPVQRMVDFGAGAAAVSGASRLGRGPAYPGIAAGGVRGEVPVRTFGSVDEHWVVVPGPRRCSAVLLLGRRRSVADPSTVGCARLLCGCDRRLAACFTGPSISATEPSLRWTCRSIAVARRRPRSGRVVRRLRGGWPCRSSRASCSTLRYVVIQARPWRFALGAAIPQRRSARVTHRLVRGR